MAVGDLTQNIRPEFHTNERLDLVDAEPMSRQALDLFKTTMKAIFGKPPATVGQPCGIVFQKPTATSVNPFEITLTGTAVGLDADGQFVVKLASPNLVQAGFGVGTSFLYLYRDEAETSTEARRFIPSVGPFNETTSSVFTKLVGVPKIIVGATGASPIVQSATVDGKQVALLCLGSATFNGGGALTGFTFTENFFGSGLLVDDRTTITFPANDTTPGSITDFITYMKALLSMSADTNWGSAATAHTGGTTAARANNWFGWKSAGAFRPGAPKIGLEETNRSTLGAVTVGDGVNTFGTIDVTDFGSVALFLRHIFETGGVYSLKPGSVFALTANVVPTTGATLNLYGNGVQIQFAGFTIDTTHMAGATFKEVSFIDTTGGGGFIFPDAGIANIKYIRCDFSSRNSASLSSTTTTPSNTIFGITCEDCTFSASSSAPSENPLCISLNNVDSIRLSRCSFTTFSACGLVSLTLAKNGIQVDDCRFTTGVSVSGLDTTARSQLAITSDFADDYSGRYVRDCVFIGTATGTAVTARSRTFGLAISEALNIDVTDNTFYRTITAIQHTLSSAVITARRFGISYVNNKISTCDKNGMLLTLRSSAILTGLKISENVLTDVKLNSALSIIGPLGALVFRDCKISENQFYNINVDTHTDFSARAGNAISITLPGNLESCSITDNSFNVCANVPININVANVRGLSIKSNSLKDIITTETLGNPTQVTHFGTGLVTPVFVYVLSTGIVSGVSVEDNTVLDILNGSTTFTDCPSLVVVVGNGISSIVVRKNTIVGLGETYSGAAIDAGYLMVVRASVSSANPMFNITVEGNSVGSTGSNTASRLALIEHAIGAAAPCHNIRVMNNVFEIRLDAVILIHFTVNDFPFIDIGGDGTTVFNNLVCKNNQVFAFGAAAWAGNFWQSRNPMLGIAITENSLWSSSGWNDSTTPKYGISFTGKAVKNFIIDGNCAAGVVGSDLTGFYGPFSANIAGGTSSDGNANSATIVQSYVGTNDAGQSVGASSSSVEHARNRGFNT